MAGETLPSTGKTVVVSAGVIAAANHVLFVAMHEVWNLNWADAIFCSDIITLAVGLTGLIMHQKQRKCEREQENPSSGITGGPTIGAGGPGPGA